MCRMSVEVWVGGGSMGHKRGIRLLRSTLARDGIIGRAHLYLHAPAVEQLAQRAAQFPEAALHI